MLYSIVAVLCTVVLASQLEKKAESPINDTKLCPCSDGGPFYGCSDHPLISSLTDSCKTFSYCDTSSSTICESSSDHDHCCRQCPCSSSSSSSKSHSYMSEHCRKRVIASYDFKRKFPVFSGRWKDWSFWNYNGIVADGGYFHKTHKGGYLDTSVYSVTSDQMNPYWADHYKYFIYSDTPAYINEQGVTTFEFTARSNTNSKGCRKFPFPSEVVNSLDDVRLASGGFRVFEPQSGMNFAFHLTNNLVYAVYERNITIAGISGFSYFIPVRPRTPKLLHRMKLIVDSHKKSVTWVLDGREVLKVDRVGGKLKGRHINRVNDMGGAEIITFPRVLYFGFGSFTFLDYYPACRPTSECPQNCDFPCQREALVRTSANPALPQYNPIYGPPTLAHYYDNFSKDSNRLWGQGSETWIRGLTVTEEMCYLVRHHGRFPCN